MKSFDVYLMQLSFTMGCDSHQIFTSKLHDPFTKVRCPLRMYGVVHKRVKSVIQFDTYTSFTARVWTTLAVIILDI